MAIIRPAFKTFTIDEQWINMYCILLIYVQLIRLEIRIISQTTFVPSWSRMSSHYCIITCEILLDTRSIECTHILWLIRMQRNLILPLKSDSVYTPAASKFNTNISNSVIKVLILNHKHMEREMNNVVIYHMILTHN